MPFTKTLTKTLTKFTHRESPEPVCPPARAMTQSRCGLPIARAVEGLCRWGLVGMSLVLGPTGFVSDDVWRSIQSMI